MGDCFLGTKPSLDKQSPASAHARVTWRLPSGILAFEDDGSCRASLLLLATAALPHAQKSQSKCGKPTEENVVSDYVQSTILTSSLGKQLRINLPLLCLLVGCTTPDIALSFFRLEAVLRSAVPSASTTELNLLLFITEAMKTKTSLILQIEDVKEWLYVIAAPFVG